MRRRTLAPSVRRPFWVSAVKNKSDGKKRNLDELSDSIWNNSSCVSHFSALGFFAISESARAVVPPPDGGYPGFNTAEGQNALFNLTTGIADTKNARTTAD